MCSRLDHLADLLDERTATVAVGHDHHAVALAHVGDEDAAEAPVAAAVAEVPALAALLDAEPDGEGPDADRRDHLARDRLRQHPPFGPRDRRAAPRSQTAPDRSASSTVPPPPAPDRRATASPRRALVRRGRAPACGMTRLGQRLLERAVRIPSGPSTALASRSAKWLAGDVRQRELHDASPRRPST